MRSPFVASVNRWAMKLAVALQAGMTISDQPSTAVSDLDAIFRLYHRELNRFAYRKLGDREAAADVVQDAFVRYLSADAQRADAARLDSPRFFLWRIVGNLMIDTIRRKRRQGIHATWDEITEDVVDPAPLPDRLLETREEFRLVKEALETLSPNCRQALLLNRVEGLTHAQIAGRLGVSPSMVSKYIMSALRRCMNALAAPDAAL